MLHQLDSIDLWNPDAPIETFWEIRYGNNVFEVWKNWLSLKSFLASELIAKIVFYCIFNCIKHGGKVSYNQIL